MKGKTLYIVFLLLFSVSIKGQDTENQRAKHHSPGFTPGRYTHRADDEDDQFLVAKRAMYEREWKVAVDRFKRYLKEYPSGKYVDEVFYWYADANSKLAGKASTLGEYCAKQIKSIRLLENILSEFPESPWVDDGNRLFNEIAGTLALLSTNAQAKGIVSSAIKKTNSTIDDLKRLGISLWDNVNDKLAEAMIDFVIEEEKNSEIRKDVFLFLGTYHLSQTAWQLQNISENDPDPIVRKRITKLLEEKQQSLIPSHLNYCGFEAILDAKEELKKIPEYKPVSMLIPKSEPANWASISKGVEQVFHFKLKNLNKTAISRGGYFYPHVTLLKNGRYNLSQSEEGDSLVKRAVIGSKVTSKIDGKRMDNESYTWLENGLTVSISHKIHDFYFSLVSEGFAKHKYKIEGKLIIDEVKPKKQHVVPYEVNEGNDRLIVIRKGKKVAMMVVQFEAEETGELDEYDIVYHSEFRDFHGHRVYSTRKTWEAKEFSRMDEYFDFDRSKTELFKDGTIWGILIGQTIYDGKMSRFVSTGAKLYYPDGKRLRAKGVTISVPIDSPDNFETSRDWRTRTHRRSRQTK